MTNHQKLSIIIPVYNERYTVEDVIRAVEEAALPEGIEKEILVVDDGSTDGTRAILEKRASERNHLRVFYQERNRGKGAAVRRGVEEASGDLIVVQDADLEYDPRDLPKLLEPVLSGHADVVYGSRFLAASGHRVLYFWHSVGNRLLTLLSNVFTNLNLSDMETGYKLAKADIWKSIPMRCNRFGMEPELTAKFARRGCRIYEVPISYYGRSYAEGKKITWRDGVKTLGVILYFAIVDDLYNEKYGHDILYSLSRTHRFNRWMADTIKPWLGEEVLEIGAGLGNLSQELLPRSKYIASDIDPLHLGYLRSKYARQGRVHVREINLEKGGDFDNVEESVDSVVCLNVVEHVKEDGIALGNIRRALKPGGRACVLVPRSPSLYGTLDEALGHERRYTENELAEKVRDAGLELVELFTFNRISVPAWWWNARVLKRKRFGRIQLKMFDATVWLWRHVDRFLPWQGVSLIAIARRPEP